MAEAAVGNIAAFLPRLAETEPHGRAVIFPEGRDAAGRVSYTHLTYAQLAREAELYARGMAAHGIGKGARTVLMVQPSLDFFALTFGLFLAGAVPVLIDPGMGLKNLKKCLEEAGPDAFIGITKAHVARILFGWPSGRLRVTVGRKLFWGGPDLAAIRAAGLADEAPLPETVPEDVAAILFTSGSTGVPKGAIYSHGNFLAQVEILRDVFGIVHGEMDLATFPLFALFGPALGMTAVIPDMDFTRPAKVEANKVFEAVENFGITNMFGSPALLNTVARAGDGVRMPSLKRVISAGAPVPARVMARFAAMLRDGVQIYTPYGATESLPVAVIGSGEVLGETAAETEQGMGVCVGRPVAAVTLRIIPVSDDPIAIYEEEMALETGEIGEICVKGAVVTRAYHNRPQSTRMAKMQDPRDGGIWHRMGDLGYIDEKGRIWFCGRKAHRVVTAEGTLYTIPVEGVFNAHPSVYRTALVGIGEPGNQEPVLCVELDREQGPHDEATIRGELSAMAARYAHTRSIRRFLFHPSFPVDIRHNAKIFREKLAIWAAGA